MEPIELTVPVEEAVLVEYPGFVQDQDAAVATLGGSDAVNSALFGSDTKHSELALRFRRGDALGHPIVAERTATNGLLLKITRQPGTTDCTVDVAARITSTFQFQGPADVQFVSADTGVSPPQVLRIWQLHGPAVHSTLQCQLQAAQQLGLLGWVRAWSPS